MEPVLADILEAVKIKMENQGDYSREAFKAFVDEAIQDFLRQGILTDDDNLMSLEERAMLQYNNIINGLNQ